jgi:hypothetical protein
VTSNTRNRLSWVLIRLPSRDLLLGVGAAFVACSLVLYFGDQGFLGHPFGTVGDVLGYLQWVLLALGYGFLGAAFLMGRARRAQLLVCAVLAYLVYVLVDIVALTVSLNASAPPGFVDFARGPLDWAGIGLRMASDVLVIVSAGLAARAFYGLANGWGPAEVATRDRRLGAAGRWFAASYLIVVPPSLWNQVHRQINDGPQFTEWRPRIASTVIYLLFSAAALVAATAFFRAAASGDSRETKRMADRERLLAIAAALFLAGNVWSVARSSSLWSAPSLAEAGWRYVLSFWLWVPSAVRLAIFALCASLAFAAYWDRFRRQEESRVAEERKAASEPGGEPEGTTSPVRLSRRLAALLHRPERLAEGPGSQLDLDPPAMCPSCGTPYDPGDYDVDAPAWLCGRCGARLGP